MKAEPTHRGDETESGTPGIRPNIRPKCDGLSEINDGKFSNCGDFGRIEKGIRGA
jgi:hypothetical protein